MGMHHSIDIQSNAYKLTTSFVYQFRTAGALFKRKGAKSNAIPKRSTFKSISYPTFKSILLNNLIDLADPIKQPSHDLLVDT